MLPCSRATPITAIQKATIAGSSVSQCKNTGFGHDFQYFARKMKNERLGKVMILV